MKLRIIELVQVAIRYSRRHERFLANAALCIFALALHQSALGGFWRFDDGYHLEFAAKYAPWQYYFQPSVTVLQSNANVTPYNALFYDINLSLFGMSPQGHYAHMIFLLALIACATYHLIRLWQSPAISLLAAGLFLAGIPTLYVGQQLMTGHYVMGLLLTILCLYSFTQGVRHRHYGLNLLGAVFYLGATTCKEIYVPIVLFLFAVPVGDIRERIKALLPYLGVAIFYTIWRFLILGQFTGGYVAVGMDWTERIRHLAGVPFLLVGWTRGKSDYVTFITSLPTFSYFGLILSLIITGFSIYRKQMSWLLIFTATSLLILPLVPLASAPGLNAADRYLFFPWWACSVLIAVLIANLQDVGYERYFKWTCAFFVISSLLIVRQFALPQIYKELARQDILYRTIINMDNNSAFLPPQDREYFTNVLSAGRRAASLLIDASIAPAKIVTSRNALCQYSDSGLRIFMLNVNCNCITDITSKVDENLLQFDVIDDGAIEGVALTGTFTLQDKVITWKLGPYIDGNYSIFLDGPLTAVPPKGSYTLSGIGPMKFKIRHDSPNGRIAISPIIEFDPIKNKTLSWSGQSVKSALPITSCSFAKRDMRH